jgi:lipoprotein Spr
MILFTWSCRHKKDITKKIDAGKKDSAVKSSDSNPLREKLGLSNKEIKSSKLYKFVDDWYGVPYRYGGCVKTGVDCSCFTNNLFEAVYGRKTPRTAGEIYRECDKVNIEKVKQGDIVFFKINGNSISHVGVYLKDNKFVHASTSKGVMINDLNETYYKKYFYSAGRLKHS